MKLKKRLRRAARLSTQLDLPLTAPRRFAEPTDLVVAFARAWSRHDADAIGRLFVEDADFVNVVGLWWRSSRAIERAHRFGFRHAFTDAKLTIGKIGERRLFDRVAVVHAEWHLTGQVDPSGMEVGPRRGVMSFVAALLDDGSWIGVACHNTDVAGGADTNVSLDGRLTATSYIERPSAELLAAADEDARRQRDAASLG